MNFMILGTLDFVWFFMYLSKTFTCIKHSMCICIKWNSWTTQNV